VQTKKMWKRTKKLAILKQLQTHFTVIPENDVGTPFPRVPAPLYPCLPYIENYSKSHCFTYAF